MDFGFAEIQGIATLLLFGLVIWLAMEQKQLKKELKQQATPNTSNNSLLPLQAYERLTLLTDRIRLKNLILRIPGANLTARELQAGLIETIRNEFEYNITQQVYVNPDIWKAITNLKEQNIYIINQIAATLPEGATAMDLCKTIVQYLENNNSDLSDMILNALQFEVKKII